MTMRLPLAAQGFLLFAGVALATLILGEPFAHFDPYPHHEGSVLYPALAALHGLRPMEDVNVEHLPTTSALYGLAFAFLGERLMVARYLTLAGTACLTGLLALAARKFLPRLLVIAFVLLLLACSWLLWDLATRPWSSLWALNCLVGALLCALQQQQNQQKRWGIAAGVLTGCVFAFRMNLGVYLALALVAAQLWIRLRDAPQDRQLRSVIRPLLPYALSAATATVLAFAILLVAVGPTGLLRLFAFQRSLLVTMHALTAAHTIPHDLGLNLVGVRAALAYGLGVGMAWPLALRSPSPLRTVGLLLVALVGAWATGMRGLDLGPGILLVAVVDIWRQRAVASSSVEQRQRVILLATAIAGWGLMAPGHDARYASWGAALVYLVAAERLYVTWRDAPLTPQRRRVFAIVAGLLFVLLLNFRYPLELWRAWQQPRVDLPAGTLYAGMRGDPKLAAEYRDLAALHDFVASHSQPTDRILVLHGETLHYAFLERAPATRPFNSLDNFSYLLPQGAQIERDDLRQLAAVPPVLIVESQQVWEVPMAWYTGTYPLVQTWLGEHFVATWHSPNGAYRVWTARP
jgi:hypothetical protein